MFLNVLLFSFQALIAALFQLAPTFLIVLSAASVSIMTYANAKKVGVVKIVPSSRVKLWTIALVRVLKYAIFTEG